MTHTMTRTAVPSFALDHNAVRGLLPHRPPLLLVDRVQDYFPADRRLVAIKNVSQNDPFIQGHFPDYPIFPGVLIVESLLQASTVLMHLATRLGDEGTEEAALSLLRSFVPPYTVLAESRVKHMAPSYPGDQIRLETQITGVAGALVSFKVRALTPSGEAASQGRISIAASAEDLPL